LNNIFSCISFRGGRNRINHREPLTTDHSSTLFSLVEAEKDIDIKVYTLFIYNNNKNVTSFSVGGSRSTRSYNLLLIIIYIMSVVLSGYSGFLQH
jgi:hypothetical protein